jgi:hypothetical protein
LGVSAVDGGDLTPGDNFPMGFPLPLDGQADPKGLKLVLFAQGRLR